MLNLRTHAQRSGVVISGNLDKPMLGMGPSQLPSTGMASRPAVVTTTTALTLTLPTPGPRTRPQQPWSMLTETLERFGAPMMDNEEESDEEYQDTIDLSLKITEDSYHPSGSLGPDRQWYSPITRDPLDQAPTRELGSP
jgi:hypothetical protein